LTAVSMTASPLPTLPSLVHADSNGCARIMT
jgi:hypothetical protein